MVVAATTNRARASSEAGTIRPYRSYSLGVVNVDLGDHVGGHPPKRKPRRDAGDVTSSNARLQAMLSPPAGEARRDAPRLPAVRSAPRLPVRRAGTTEAIHLIGEAIAFSRGRAPSLVPPPTASGKPRSCTPGVRRAPLAEEQPSWAPSVDGRRVRARGALVRPRRPIRRRRLTAEIESLLVDTPSPSPTPASSAPSRLREAYQPARAARSASATELDRYSPQQNQHGAERRR